MSSVDLDDGNCGDLLLVTTIPKEREREEGMTERVQTLSNSSFSSCLCALMMSASVDGASSSLPDTMADMSS